MPRTNFSESVPGVAGKHGKAPGLRQLVIGSSNSAIEQLLDDVAGDRLAEKTSD
jgi:hypothetical protein